MSYYHEMEPEVAEAVRERRTKITVEQAHAHAARLIGRPAPLLRLVVNEAMADVESRPILSRLIDPAPCVEAEVAAPRRRKGGNQGGPQRGAQYKGAVCKYGHNGQRYVATKVCVECNRLITVKTKLRRSQPTAL